MSLTQQSAISNQQSAAFSLESATMYLASRARVRTPLGAGEYLHCVRHHAREEFDERVRLAIDCCNLYQQIFPGDYARSPAPPFSIAREHEFYRLVHTQCFPLLVDEEMYLPTLMEQEPRFFLPFIPVRGIQKHHWTTRHYDYDKLDLPYQLALLMSTADSRPVTLLDKNSPLDLPAIAPPLSAVGYGLFKHSCRVDDSPLKYLPLAFNLISYRTGNIWLDMPPVGYAGEAWDAKQIARLTIDRMNADKFDIAMRMLHNWLMADPPARLRHAIELWNDASEKEKSSGYAGMSVHDLADEAGFTRLGDGMVVMAPEGVLQQMYGEEA